ncbi:hypothetical protein [Psychroserpens ponticola]|uniref:Tetratricopeptide repeat protein n=1 Tax=Psychroserpens ponticola TaxID=2932268 RepID=A0ABY7RU77_9FLAO|nr:hypothetical protein [Psychroserpens ponticola]WCO00317.1 hypothetical protein MUN68_009560 [Psychroserpens ponticola]
MKKLICLFIIINCLSVNSQTYSSNYEEDIFNNIKKDSINYKFFESLLAIDPSMTPELASDYKLEVNSIIKSVPPKEKKEKKEKKRIEKLYDDLHDTFFIKYRLNAYFNDIFENGTYNCVTATALYSYVFEELNIPYHVKETPSHVFLVVYPNTYKIYLETTVPGQYGFITPKESEIKKIVDELISYKLVTSDEVSKKGYLKFYEDYFYGKEYIDKRALIGMQYYNKGLIDFENEANDEALNNFKKTKIFYSSPLIDPIIKNIMFINVNELEFNTKKDVDYLIELLSISKFPEDYSISNLKSSLFKIIDHDDNDNAFIEYTIEKFKNITDPNIKNEAIEFLLEYLAENAARNEELDEAINYCDDILLINPKNKRIKSVVSYVAFKKVKLSSYNMEALTAFESICEKYEFLKENNRYNISLAYLYARISFKKFKSKNISEANEYLQKLEFILDNNDILDEVSNGLLSDLYIKAGNYYYYKNQYKRSYKIYKKGLTYVPDHNELKKRANWSKDEF